MAHNTSFSSNSSPKRHRKQAKRLPSVESTREEIVVHTILHTMAPRPEPSTSSNTASTSTSNVSPKTSPPTPIVPDTPGITSMLQIASSALVEESDAPQAPPDEPVLPDSAQPEENTESLKAEPDAVVASTPQAVVHPTPEPQLDHSAAKIPRKAQYAPHPFAKFDAMRQGAMQQASSSAATPPALAGMVQQQHPQPPPPPHHLPYGISPEIRSQLEVAQAHVEQIRAAMAQNPAFFNQFMVQAGQTLQQNPAAVQSDSLRMMLLAGGQLPPPNAMNTVLKTGFPAPAPSMPPPMRHMPVPPAVKPEQKPVIQAQIAGIHAPIASHPGGHQAPPPPQATEASNAETQQSNAQDSLWNQMHVKLARDVTNFNSQMKAKPQKDSHAEHSQLDQSRSQDLQVYAPSPTVNALHQQQQQQSHLMLHNLLTKHINAADASGFANPLAAMSQLQQNEASSGVPKNQSFAPPTSLGPASAQMMALRAAAAAAAVSKPADPLVMQAPGPPRIINGLPLGFALAPMAAPGPSLSSGTSEQAAMFSAAAKAAGIPLIPPAFPMPGAAYPYRFYDRGGPSTSGQPTGLAASPAVHNINMVKPTISSESAVPVRSFAQRGIAEMAHSAAAMSADVGRHLLGQQPPMTPAHLAPSAPPGVLRVGLNEQAQAFSLHQVMPNGFPALQRNFYDASAQFQLGQQFPMQRMLNAAHTQQNLINFFQGADQAKQVPVRPQMAPPMTPHVGVINYPGSIHQQLTQQFIQQMALQQSMPGFNALLPNPAGVISHPLLPNNQRSPFINSSANADVKPDLFNQ